VAAAEAGLRVLLWRTGGGVEPLRPARYKTARPTITSRAASFRLGLCRVSYLGKGREQGVCLRGWVPCAGRGKITGKGLGFYGLGFYGLGFRVNPRGNRARGKRARVSRGQLRELEGAIGSKAQ